MFTWTPEMIRLMQNANARSEYHRQLAAILAPKLAGCRTLCDAGCGLGSLSAALIPYFDAITAADVSDAALDVLRETIRTQNQRQNKCHKNNRHGILCNKKLQNRFENSNKYPDIQSAAHISFSCSDADNEAQRLIIRA